jgi:peptidoglycan-associated lipoprotein
MAWRVGKTGSGLPGSDWPPVRRHRARTSQLFEREEMDMKGRSRTRWAWTLVAVAVILLIAAGCSKKQTVKSTEEAPPAAAVPAPKPAGTPPGTIATEPVKPEIPPAPPAAAVTPRTTETDRAGVAATQERLSSFQDIHFDFDKALIRDDAKPALMSVADYLKKTQGAEVLIEGHCDERGTAEYNMALGERRAESIRSYLVTLGVSPGVLSIASFGKEKPADQGHDEAAWARNRRAHFVRK